MLKNLITKGYRRNEAKSWPTHDGKNLDRTKFVTASEIGSCARKIWYDKRTPKHQLDRYGFAERGHTAEAWVVEQLRRSGAKVLCVGDDQKSFYHGPLSGTPDGVLRTEEGDFLFDIKCVDPRANWSAFPRAKDVEQVRQNIALVNACYGFDIAEGFITYIDATDYEHIVETPIIGDDEYVWNTNKPRADMILSAEKAADLDPEGVFNGGCRFCDHRSKCSGAVQMASVEREKNKEMINAASKLFG